MHTTDICLHIMQGTGIFYNHGNRQNTNYRDSFTINSCQGDILIKLNLQSYSESDDLEDFFVQFNILVELNCCAHFI